MSFRSAFKWRLALLGEWLKAPPDTVWKAGHADIIFMSADANKTDDGDGNLVDRILDPLREKFEQAGYRCLSVSLPGSQVFGQGSLYFAHSLSKRAFFEQITRSLNVLLAKLRIVRLSAADLDGSAVFEKLFKSTQCKMIFALNTTAGLCQAGYRTNTPVIEVLHARGYSVAYTEEWISQDRVNLPAGIIAYDEASAEAFGSSLPTLLVPHYRLNFEMKLAERFSDSQMCPAGLTAPQTTRRILLTLSYNPAQPSWTGGLTDELVDLVRRNPGYFLMVRIHPVMKTGVQYASAIASLKEQLQEINNADIEWSSTAPL